MSRTLNITQEIGAKVDWKKLAKDLIKEFNIDVSEEDIISFLVENEIKYLIVEDYGKEMRELQKNDITGDEGIIRVLDKFENKFDD